MKIGLYVQWPLGSIDRQKGNVLGDELFGRSLAKSLSEIKGVQAELFAPNHLPAEKLDYMIYLNDNKPHDDWAKKRILYLQNGFGEEASDLLSRVRQHGYDGYIFFSQKLLKMHIEDGYEGIFLPFGVDLKSFYPREIEDEYKFEVSYVGNDIKGPERSIKYLYPAAKFNFGLYGNWTRPRSRFRIWKNWAPREPYQVAFEKISKGKIPQEKVPVLYSSSAISLNCTIQSCVDWDVITLRTFEVLACKGFLISDLVPSAEKALKDSVVFTTGGADLEEKIRYYLDKPNLRRDISQNGYERVIKEASIEARSKDLLNYIEQLK